MTDPKDMQGCESCGKEFPVESMTMMEGDWICEGCYAEWKQVFDTCDHKWRPHTSVLGEPGRVCERCSGFVADEDAAVVGV